MTMSFIPLFYTNCIHGLTKQLYIIRVHSSMVLNLAMGQLSFTGPRQKNDVQIKALLNFYDPLVLL